MQHGVSKDAFDAAEALVDLTDITISDAMKWLPKQVVRAARRVCDKDAVFVEIAQQWPWLVQAARLDNVFGHKSRSKNPGLKKLQGGVAKLDQFMKWMNDPDGGLGEDRVGLRIAYIMARADGLVDDVGVIDRLQRDLEAVDRLCRVLRNFSGMEDTAKRSRTFWPSLARFIWDLHEKFELGEPVRSGLSPDIDLMGAIAKAIGIDPGTDAPLKCLCAAGR
jgi:hypothetical protein